MGGYVPGASWLESHPEEDGLAVDCAVEVSPELEALVAKHAPSELHLLRPSGKPRLPRRGPTLSDLLDDSGNQPSHTIPSATPA